VPGGAGVIRWVSLGRCKIAASTLREFGMAAKWKWTLGIIGTLLLVLIICFIVVDNRGGRYPTFQATSLATLTSIAPLTSLPSDPLVKIDSGSLRGIAVQSSIAFRGIPYAQPPVGDLRWQPPQPPQPWQGVREASQPGTTCTQRKSGLTPFFAPMAQAYGSNFEQPPIQSSEDCLYLDVWVPEWPVKRALPVMVWLHGGSNTVGSGTQSSYDGVALTRHGVLLVTLNYRLGVMGFFSHPELTAESAHHSSGNYGLLDQLAALSWVKRNIAQFGGDPNNVTLFGESAGAIDTARLMTSPLAAGLFKRAISESGPSFDVGQTLSQAETFGVAVGELAPGDAKSTALKKLRALPAADVETLVAKAKTTLPTDITAATADGWVLPMSPQRAFLSGSIQKVDFMIGLNKREFSAFRLSAAAAAKASGRPAADTGGLKKIADLARPYFGGWTNAAIAVYFGKIVLNKNAGLDASANDLIGACPVGAMASLTEAAGQRVFVYRFDRSVPGKGEAELGAFHSLEVPYVFGALNDREWQWLPANADDVALSDLMQVYWTNFAKTGNPNAPGLPNWPSWGDDKMEFLVFTQDAGVTTQRNFQPLFSSLSTKDLKESFKPK
jgi:para-nitrobenzyl esterase